MRRRSACRISSIWNAAGRVSISTVAFIVPTGSCSSSSAALITSSHNAASSIASSLGR